MGDGDSAAGEVQVIWAWGALPIFSTLWAQGMRLLDQSRAAGMATESKPAIPARPGGPGRGAGAE